MKRKIFFIMAIILLIVSVCVGVYATSRRGSTGSEVRKIQDKLKDGDIILEVLMEFMVVLQKLL